MIKKTRVWKVAILSIVTFGLYSIFWFVFRRNEITSSTKLHIPHWRWLILPMLISLGFGAWLGVVLSDPNHIPSDAELAYLPLGIGLILVTFIIGLWWGWYFSKAIEQLTQGRITKWWALFYWFVLGVEAPSVFQYYLNRAPKKLDTSKKLKYTPSGKFIAVSIVLTIVSIPLYALVFLPPDDMNQPVDTPESAAKAREVEKLSHDYDNCVAELNAAYPEDQELTADNEAAYSKAYDTCEALRLKQNKVADEYEKLLEEL